MKMKQILFIAILLLVLGCKNKRSFEWTEELEQTTGGDLKEWLKKAPFNGRWDAPEKESGKMVFTNIEQVFPFIGKFNNENDDFKGVYVDGDIYQKETTVFKDSLLGESVVYAALLYEPQELFLRDYYSESGNIILSGPSASNMYYNADLSETLTCENNSEYKTAIYWVDLNAATYLFGFYQKGNLIFQFGFPCTVNEKLKGVQKIKEINLALGLNVKEWSNVTESKLEINKSPKSFWKEPYYGVYEKRSMSQLDLKIENTEFVLQKGQSKEKGVDYLFAYGDNNAISISLSLENTTLTKEEFEDEFEDFKQITLDHIKTRQLFIKKEHIVEGQFITEAAVYFRDNSILKIKSSYPENDVKAKDQLLDILSNIRISIYY